MTMNEKLLEAQKVWETQCYEILKKEYDDNKEEKGKLSCAFGFGVSEHYAKSDKRIMIVGQEANNHTCDYDNWPINNWQKWAIDYLNLQVYGEKSEEYKDMGKNYSPFWQFFRAFWDRGEGYDVCWNNLDKARAYICRNGKDWVESKLPYDKVNYDNRERKILNGKIFEGKSLLQKEIEIVNPNCVIFAVGPNNPYYQTICDAFFKLDKYEELLEYPTIDKPLVDITDKLNLQIPVYYTYHPNFLRRNEKFDEVVNEIKEKLQNK